MAEAVYILCMLTSLACALLLARAYLRTRTRLLLWSALCFLALTLNNLLLVLDLIVFPQIDLSLYRSLSSFAAAALLLFGLLWDTD